MDRSEITADGEHIEQWAREHDSVPVREGDRLHLVPEEEVTTTQERVDWDTFHRHMNDRDQVVMRHDDPSGRKRFEVTDRSSALDRVTIEEEYGSDEIEERLLEGEKITGSITETTVVTETIVEEATLESEVVDRQIADRQVTNLELLDRTCHSCSIVGEGGELEYGDTYETDRFLIEDADATTGEMTLSGEYPYHVTVEVDENWSVTIEEQERYTVETRITDYDVTETDTIEGRDLKSHIDIEAVHDQLLDSIDLSRGDETRVVDTDTYNMESEFTEEDAILTNLTGHTTLDKEVSERWRLTTEVVEGELLSRDTISETVRQGRATGREGEYAETTGDVDKDHRMIPEKDDVGKPVVVSTGDQIGMVSEVEGDTVYVDPHPGITEKIMAKLGWGGKDEGDFPLQSDRIKAITSDEVQLSGDYDEAELENIDRRD